MKKDIAILVARLIVGGVFIAAGYFKVANMTGTLASFNEMGIPAFLTYIVSYGELIGGIFLVLGLWVCASAAFLSIIMIAAIYLSYGMGFQAYMVPLVTLSSLISLVGSCGGKYSISACVMCKKCNADSNPSISA